MGSRTPEMDTSTHCPDRSSRVALTVSRTAGSQSITAVRKLGLERGCGFDSSPWPSMCAPTSPVTRALPQHNTKSTDSRHADLDRIASRLAWAQMRYFNSKNGACAAGLAPGNALGACAFSIIRSRISGSDAVLSGRRAQSRMPVVHPFPRLHIAPEILNGRLFSNSLCIVLHLRATGRRWRPAWRNAGLQCGLSQASRLGVGLRVARDSTSTSGELADPRLWLTYRCATGMDRCWAASPSRCWWRTQAPARASCTATPSPSSKTSERWVLCFE